MIIKYDLNRDFKEVKHLSLVALDEDGEEFEFDVKVAYSSHAWYRMYDEQNRYCESEDVENLIRKKANEILEIKNKEQFVIVDDMANPKLAVVCQMHNQDGFTVIIVITVIHKVLFVGSQIIEKRVFIDKSKNKVI